MLRGGGAVDIVCDAQYQDVLDRICGGKTPGGHERPCVAALVIEPENPQDPNAVAVYIETQQVGYSLARTVSRTSRCWRTSRSNAGPARATR